MLVGDITYLKTRMGWLYLAIVIDLATRKVLGWHVPDSMRTPLVITALEAALGNGAAQGVCSILTGAVNTPVWRLNVTAPPEVLPSLKDESRPVMTMP